MAQNCTERPSAQSRAFRTNFVARRVSKATASVAALECLPPSGFCINERVNYLAQVTEFSLNQDSLAHMDTIID